GGHRMGDLKAIRPRNAGPKTFREDWWLCLRADTRHDGAVAVAAHLTLAAGERLTFRSQPRTVRTTGGLLTVRSLPAVRALTQRLRLAERGSLARRSPARLDALARFRLLARG